MIKLRKSKTSKNLTGGQAAVQSLKKEQVKHLFGLIGSATIEMFDALYHEKKIKFIGVRDERTGTHMADGYARASNKPGVILAGQNGPGATNLVTGIAQAAAAFSPVVSIAGSYSTKDKVQDAFQGIDQQSLFKPITKKTWTISAAKKIPKIFNEIPKQDVTDFYVLGISEFNIEDEIIVHCKSGGRSAKICKLLIENQFTNVKNVKGGILAWSREIDSSIPQY